MFNPEISENTISTSSSRLIVLVPGGISEASRFAQQLNRLALQSQCGVLFLAMKDQDADELSTGRFLATLEALTRDPQFEVSSRLVDAANWVKAIDSVYRPEDKIVCHQGQLAPAGFGKGIPLDEYLREQQHRRVHVLDGFYQIKPVQPLAWLRGIGFWLGSLAIVILFSLFEFRVDHVMVGTTRLLILVILLVSEVALIYELNKYTG